MGRRSLPKVNPQLDLSQHHLEWEELPDRIGPQAWGLQPCGWELEIGSGKGLFLRTAAAAHPTRLFVGIEIAAKYARFAAAGLAKRDLPNARVIHADAQRVIAERVGDAELDAVHVYFPDPWWKKRHRRRRVLKESLLRQVQRVLVPGGRLHFWTDVEEYFQTTCELAAQVTVLEGPLKVDPQAPQHDLDYRTHFERRTRLGNRPVWRAEFVRPPTLTAPTYPSR